MKSQTAVQRRNNRMRRIFEQAAVNNARCAPLHLWQVLARVTEQAELIYSIQHMGL